jgi:hypothetical protein
MVEFVTTFGFYWLGLLNRLENEHKGHILWLFIISWADIHYTLAPNWLEDYIYEDMNESYGNKGLESLIMQNMGTYGSRIVGVPLLIAIQYKFHGQIFRFANF